MSTSARKARKRAGIPFQHPTKVGTPLLERTLPQHFSFDALFGWSGSTSARRRRQQHLAPLTEGYSLAAERRARRGA